MRFAGGAGDERRQVPHRLGSLIKYIGDARSLGHVAVVQVGEKMPGRRPVGSPKKCVIYCRKNGPLPRSDARSTSGWGATMGRSGDMLEPKRLAPKCFHGRSSPPFNFTFR